MLLNFLPGDRELIDDDAGVAHQDIAGLGRDHALRAAKQQRAAQFGFQVADMQAQRGLGDVEKFSGLGKRSLLHNRDEISELPEIHIEPT